LPPKAARQARQAKPAPAAPIRTKQEDPDKKDPDPTESVELDTRRRYKESRSKAEDDDDDDYEDDDDDSDDILPEAQPANPRNQVDPKTAKFRHNALHVYGLDFLRTGHMDEIFSQFDHKFVEWINDSSANIIFSDPNNAKKALESLSFPKVGDEPWRRTPDILVSEDVPPIFLQMRLATSTDAKRVKKAMPKILPFDDVGPKGRSRGKGRRTNSDGAKDDSQDGLSTKRPRPPPTAEEIAARAKRAQRFEDWLADSKQPEKARSDSPKKVSGRKIQQVMETTDEELAKRRRRQGRFADDDDDKPAPASAAATEGSSATAPPAEPTVVDKELAAVSSEPAPAPTSEVSTPAAGTAESAPGA